MGKMLNVVAAAAILGAATTAFAAEPPHKTTGKIKSVDLMTACHHLGRRLDL